MEDNEQDRDNDNVLVFDHFYTNNHIQIMKSLLPYIGGSTPSMLPVLIKYMELRYTIALAKRGAQPFAQACGACSAPVGAQSLCQDTCRDIYREVRRYLSPDEERGFAQMLDMMSMLDNARQLQQMMEFMQGMDAMPGMGDAANCVGDMSALAGMPGGDMDLGALMELMNTIKG